MNIYGKEATAYYDLHQGMNSSSAAPTRRPREIREKRHHRRGTRGIRRRGARAGQPEMDGEKSTAPSPCCSPGVKSAREGRRVEVCEILAGD